MSNTPGINMEDHSTEEPAIFTTVAATGEISSSNIKPEVGGILIFIMSVSVIGNCFVITVIFVKMGGLNRTINCMVLSLAFADLMQQIFLNFPLVYTYLRGFWDLGLFFCKGHTWIRSSTTIASVYTLVAIGIER